MRLQSAIEYLTTYGWALIILAVVLTALFLLGIFNGSNFTPSECLISSGFTCGSYAFGKDGTFNLNLQQSTSTPINITAFGCAQNGTISNTVMQKPLNPPSNQIFMPVGGNVTIVMKCYSNNGIFQGNIGTVFSGTIIINYTNDFTNIPNVAIGKLVVKVSALSVTTASTISTTSTSSTSTSSTSTSTTVTTTSSTTSSTTTIYSVPLTLTNSQSSATPVPFQQMITINSQTYQSYINSGWTNVEFTTGSSGTGTQLQAWVESNPSNSVTNTVVWVNLPNGIAGSGSTTIYMDFMSSNVMSSSGPTGEAPQLSASYGQYDNGNTVFNFYDNFAGTSLDSLWFVVTGGGSPSITVNNGLTFTAPSGSCSASGIRSVSAFGTNTVFDFDGLPAGSAAASAFGFVNEVTWASEWGCGSGATAMMYTKPSPNNELSGLYASDTSTGYSSGTKIWTILNGVTQIGSLLNYGSPVSATRSQSVIYNSMNIGFFSQGSDTAWSIQWVRVRAYPPGGVMPGASPALYSVPLTLTNSQSSATPAPFQQMIAVNSLKYQSYINSGWTNVEFTSGNYAAGTPGMTYNAWVESNPSNSATNTVVWVNLPNGIAGSSSTTIYMDFMSSNVMSSSGPTGEAPQLSSTYGQYDNGNAVFNFYDNFAGTTLSSKWNANGASYSVNNGLTYNPNSNYDVLASTTSFTAPYIIDYYGYGTATTSDAGVYFDIQRTSANSNSILWAQRGSTQAQDMFYIYTSGGYTQYGSWTYSMDGNYHIYTLEDGPSDNPLITQTGYATQETYTSMPSTYTSGYFGPRQCGSSVEYWQWVRTRAYPPSGVMPGVSGI